jgi:5-formyltetrahydrofolate cyclo-ligase
MQIIDSSAQKQKIREQLLKKRKRLSAYDYTSVNKEILQRLLQLDTFKKAQTIHVYLPIVKRKEIDTLPIIRLLLKKGKNVVVPITEFDRIALRHVALVNMEDLKTNRWGVPEPVQQIAIDIQELDLVIVPMVGGDMHGNRLGYGKGYYDSFLKKVNCPKIGLLPETCLVDNIPVEEHDVPLDFLITEDRIIHARGEGR